MLNVAEYVKLLLKKNNMTLNEFANAINEVKKKIGDESKITKQNISNYLNHTDDQHILRPKQLCIWEKALNLPQGTLVNMVASPVTVESKRELKQLMKKVGNIDV